MEPTNVLPIAAILSLVTVEYGGWALLSFLTGREGLSDWQKGFFRAGHAHAGVLLVLTLVYLLYLPRADFSDGLEWAAGGVLLAGVLAQSGGFFLHMGVGQPGVELTQEVRDGRGEHISDGVLSEALTRLQEEGLITKDKPGAHRAVYQATPAALSRVKRLRRFIEIADQTDDEPPDKPPSDKHPDADE